MPKKVVSYKNKSNRTIFLVIDAKHLAESLPRSSHCVPLLPPGVAGLDDLAKGEALAAREALALFLAVEHAR